MCPIATSDLNGSLGWPAIDVAFTKSDIVRSSAGCALVWVQTASPLIIRLLDNLSVYFKIHPCCSQQLWLHGHELSHHQYARSASYHVWCMAHIAAQLIVILDVLNHQRKMLQCNIDCANHDVGNIKIVSFEISKWWMRPAGWLWKCRTLSLPWHLCCSKAASLNACLGLTSPQTKFSRFWMFFELMYTCFAVANLQGMATWIAWKCTEWSAKAWLFQIHRISLDLLSNFCTYTCFHWVGSLPLKVPGHDCKL